MSILKIRSIKSLSKGKCVASPTLTDPIHRLAEKAAEEVKLDFRESLPTTLLAKKGCVAPFKWDECTLGQKLGEGQFSEVYEVKSFCSKDKHFPSIELSVEESDQRVQMQESQEYHGTKEARYALKFIKPKYLQTYEGKTIYIQAAKYLALEAEFLSSLTHPHIIKLRGVAHSSPTGCALILDYLLETLDQRIRSWHTPTTKKRAIVPTLQRSVSGLSAAFKTRPGGKGSSRLRKHMYDLPAYSTDLSSEPDVNGKDEVMDERLTIAFQVASAMKFLHSHCIIFRDLKPTNIGFDVRGDAKIFDFGLARFCPAEGDPNIDTYEMSGSGSPRYMAPECLRGGTYNLKADVYSFAILLWQVLSGKTPYEYPGTKDEFINFIVAEHGRPDIDSSWPNAIQIMMEHSFSADIGARPDMAHVHNTIRCTLKSLRNSDSSKLDDEWVSSQRTTACDDE